MSSDQPLLQINQLCRSFGSVKAVDSLSFDIQAGACVGLIGANGAGKTTLMRILSTLDLPDSGILFYKGIDVLAHPEKVRAEIGWMPDAMDMWPHTTVKDYLDFVARVNGFKGKNRKETVRYWADFCGVTSLFDRNIDKLSKGESQRLGLARMLIGDPQFLILDEPAAGLDPQARLYFKQLIHQLQAQGRTLLISSHILSELAEMCDSMIMMDAGAILFSGRSDDLMKKIQSRTAPRVRMRPLADMDGLKMFLKESDSWTKPKVDGEWIEASYADDIDEAAQADLMAELMANYPLLEFRRVEMSWEEGFISLLHEGVQ